MQHHTITQNSGGLPCEKSPFIEANHVARLRGARVLVIDDDNFNLEVARCILERVGVNVITASSGVDGLRALELGRFDCVFMDYRMPVMDGIETTLRIRADPRFSKTRVVALTANSSSSERERFLSSGMNDVVAKPYRAVQLIDALARNIVESVD